MCVRVRVCVIQLGISPPPVRHPGCPHHVEDSVGAGDVVEAAGPVRVHPVGRGAETERRAALLLQQPTRETCVGTAGCVMLDRDKGRGWNKGKVQHSCHKRERTLQWRDSDSESVVFLLANTRETYPEEMVREPCPSRTDAGPRKWEV